MTTTIRKLSALAACFLLAAPAYGQDLSIFNAYNTMGINIANTVGLNAAANAQAKRVAGERGKDQGDRLQRDDVKMVAAVAELSFQPDPAVSREIKDEFTRAVVKADPAKADHIRSVMASQDVLADFDRDMAPYGFKSNNTAGALTAYWVTMWMIANEKGIPSRQRVAAAHKQVVSNLTGNAMYRKATPRQRQEMTEALVYETMFALGQRANAEKARDWDRQRELAKSAQASLMKQGVNLQSLRLTRAGFQP